MKLSIAIGVSAAFVVAIALSSPRASAAHKALGQAQIGTATPTQLKDEVKPPKEDKPKKSKGDKDDNQDDGNNGGGNDDKPPKPPK
jgi:hypothetical protein